MSASGPPALLAPALWLADRVRTSTRLAVLVVVLVLPGLGANAAYTTSVNAQLDFTGAERAGTEVVHPALQAMAALAAGSAPDLSILRSAVAAHDELDLRAALDAVPATGGVPAATALAGLIIQAGNNSNLVLDSDLDSFYVMEIEVVELPRALLAAVAAARPDTGLPLDKQVAAQAVQAGTLKGAAAAIRSARDTAAKHTEDGGLAGRLAPLTAVADAADTLATNLTETLAKPAAGDATRIAAATDAALGPVTAQLRRLLDARLHRFSRDRMFNLTTTAVGLVIAIWLAAAVWWRTRHDVHLTVAAVTATAEGDLSERELPAGRDELGDIGRALRKARDRLAEQDAALRNAQLVREQQLHASFEQQREGQRQLRERAQGVVNESVGGITRELQDVRAQVDEVREAAQTIEERVSAADRATASVVERAGQAERVVAALGESLRQVDGTTQLIAGIAAQTRLLALNATIEAARAGEAGRGFTVVANEVKDLAGTTAQSTEQIAATIASLERSAADMASTIAAMVAGVGGIGEATGVLHTVALDQHGVVQRLDLRVNETLDRIQQMSAIAERLERRHAERIAATGPVKLALDGGRESVTAELKDLSNGGLRCGVPGTLTLRGGDAVDVELTLDGPPVRLHSQVVHCVAAHGETELGLQFLAPPEDAVRHIERYVNAPG